MVVTKEIERLRAVARQAQEQIAAIEDADRRKSNGAKVGRYFRMRNNYSCPEKPSDYWWLYAKCTRMDDEGFLYVLAFETDKNGDVRIQFDHYAYHLDGYRETTKAEFDRAWKKMQAKIANAI